MSIIDVEKMEFENEQNNFFEKMDKIDEETNKKISKTKSVPKLKTLKKKNQPFKQMQKEIKQREVEDKEFYDSTKDSMYQLLSIPMKDPDKKKVLEDRLKNSKYLNNYVKNSIYNSYASYLNEHAKALIIYGYHYTQVYKDPKIGGGSIPPNNIEQ